MNASVCPICYEDYGSSPNIPVIGTCGHTICSTCRVSMNTFKCPLCQRKDAFKKEAINRQLLDLLMFRRRPEQENETNNASLKCCGKCGVFVKRLRICVKCSMEKGIVKKCLMEEPNVEEELKQVEQSAICSDCVLDDGHLKHGTQYFDNFLKGYTEFLKPAS